MKINFVKWQRFFFQKLWLTRCHRLKTYPESTIFAKLTEQNRTKYHLCGWKPKSLTKIDQNFETLHLGIIEQIIGNDNCFRFLGGSLEIILGHCFVLTLGKVFMIIIFSFLFQRQKFPKKAFSWQSSPEFWSWFILNERMCDNKLPSTNN